MLFPFHDDNPTARFPAVTVTIIAINVMAFIYTFTLPPDEYAKLVARYGFVPQRLAQLRDPQLVVDVPVRPEIRRIRDPFGRVREIQQPVFMRFGSNPREIIQSLFTSLFLHGGLDHIVGNMWFFWIFGNNIEDRLGRVRFTGFYLAAGVFASLCHWLMTRGHGGNVPVIGASGAVAAVLGAYAVLYPHARVRSLVFLVIFFTVIELPALAVLGFWFFGQLVQALGGLGNLNLNGGVAWWAHVGGFALGALVIHWIVQYPSVEYADERPWSAAGQDDGWW